METTKSIKTVNQRGFTLIEVLVVMTILAILAAVAIPNYTEYIQRGQRSEAKATLLQAAQWLERFRTENNGYATTTSGAAMTLPASFSTVSTSGTTRYVVTITGLTATGYVLVATRQGNDSCGNFKLTSAGARSVVIGTTEYTSGSEFERCWGR